MEDEKLLHRTMVAVVFGALMSMLDTTIVNVAIRSLSVRLHTPLPSVQWVVTGYLLALAATLPLLDVRLYARPAYAASSLVNFALGAAVFGAMILLPLYYQVIRYQGPVATGLLVAPTSIGAAIGIRAGAKLTDRIGTGRTALAGGLLASAGTVPFLFLGTGTPYAWLSVVMVFRGLGIGLCLVPAMTATYRAIPAAKIADATVQLDVLNRLGGSAGTAVFTMVLQHSLAADGAAAFGMAFRWALGAAVLTVGPAILLIRAESRPPRIPAQEPPKPGSPTEETPTVVVRGRVEHRDNTSPAIQGGPTQM